MFRRLVARFSALFLPFASIARELQVMNELKELELENRINPKTGEAAPIYRITEAPGRKDTEITYSGDEQSTRDESVAETLANALDETED